MPQPARETSGPLDKERATELVSARLRDYHANGGPDLVLLEDRTVTRPFGWVFFYQSRAYVETGAPSEQLGGNAPIIVDRDTGELHETGTAHPITHYIREYAQAKLARAEAARPRCPGCGGIYDERAVVELALTERKQDGRKVCMAIWTCGNCAERWWRWNDRRDDPLVRLDT